MRQENDCSEDALALLDSLRSPKVSTDLSDERREELKGVLTVDAGKVESHLAGKVRQAVEDVLNDLLDADADDRCGAKRYVRSPDRQDTRAGYYRRSLETQAGAVELKVPKLRKLPFESAIIGIGGIIGLEPPRARSAPGGGGVFNFLRATPSGT